MGRRVVGPDVAVAPRAAMLVLVSRCKSSILLRSGSLVSLIHVIFVVAIGAPRALGDLTPAWRDAQR
ncbi:hypothetical protein NY99_06005 [Xanthomonas phaseoli pv. phaseoli]|nr:hypothetical protein NY99_06005 [Xanthomonas phaseoli pv. phaseoli]KHS08147.1 hypothetical protein RM61_07135 [Xanthomonas phaseoli pv. phaseoli]KKY07738.1 hypothetical protein RM60_23890 [Xanthomonas phaseoli pv. phaseoli]